MVLKKSCLFRMALLASCISIPVACGSPRDAEISASQPEATGELVLPLISATQSSFRLRQAVFEVSSRSGLTSLRLNSETDSEGDALHAELEQGAYTVRLEDGWVLESLAEDGAAIVEHAALVSANPSEFEIRDGRVTRLVFAFSTGQGLVRFGVGGVAIGVTVMPSATASCNLLDPSSCPGEQSCLLVDDSGQTFCAAPGSLPVGAACSAEQCVRGAQCLKLDPASPEQGVCAKFCNPAQIEFGCECRSLSFDSAIGVCDPPPFPTCDPLSQTGCSEGETCQHLSGNHAICGASGTGQMGEACLGETCAAGLDCFGDQPELGIVGSCTQFCDTGAGYYACPFNSYPYYHTCQDVGTGNVGRCL